MANPEHVAKLKEGFEAWNKWRDANTEITPDLEGVDITTDEFRGTALDAKNDDGCSFISLLYYNFRGVRLQSANLQRARLSFARLQDAALCNANLSCTDLRSARLEGANLSGAKLQNADLREAKVQGADLRSAELQGANLGFGDFRHANFAYANLQGAKLSHTKLQQSVLFGAEMGGADLAAACLRGADLRLASLESAHVSGVTFDRRSRQQKFQGIRVATCYGSQMFKSFAQDQDFIEEFRTSRPWLFRLWWISADCGHSFIRWAGLSLALALFFAIIYYLMGSGHIKPDVPLPFSFWTMIYYSVVTFTTLGFGDVKPQTELAAMIVVVEVIIGYIMLGGLIAILANKVARRS